MGQGKRLIWCLGSGKQECSGESFTEALMAVGHTFTASFRLVEAPLWMLVLSHLLKTSSPLCLEKQGH